MEELQSQLQANRLKKVASLKELLALTATQKAQLLEDDAEAFAQTAESWEAVAKTITDLEKNSQALLLQQLQQQPAIAALEEEAHRLLLQLRDAQAECGRIAAQRMEEYKNSLKDAQKTHKRAVSYTNPYTISEDGIYFDKKK